MYLTILPWLFWSYFLCCVKFYLSSLCGLLYFFQNILFLSLFSHHILSPTLMLVRSSLFCIFIHLTFRAFATSWFSKVWLSHFRNVSYKYWRYLNIFDHIFFYQHQKLVFMTFHILSPALTIKMMRILKFIKSFHHFLFKKNHPLRKRYHNCFR